ncbi:hypothetical protein BUALT_Bualt02G0093900 [Buddleja alternifolia]|uniref:SWIM-type domain-containing protein n=1 Tax=Buddleja alternifolia TaxID=168488 RepID=A0AAV6Y2Z4_9LAMI|nr:hypothetical protein BUALT_Bualt02G0093900 [Buddleja alternifolia]
MTNVNQVIEMWVNGKMLRSSTVKYVGGQMHKFVSDLDMLSYQSLVDMYMSCGGRKSVVNFYFKKPGVPLDVGLRTIRYDLVDITMCDLVGAYDGLDPDIHIPIWVEEIADPIAVIDAKGNPLDLMELLSDKRNYLLTGIDFNDSYEADAIQGFRRVEVEEVGSNNETVPEINKETVGEDNTDGHISLEELEEHDDTVRAKNLGSLILLRKQERVEPPIFDKMYYSLAAMRIGFLAGWRPIIGLDGCFLKTIFGGQLQVALGRDGDDNIWPIEDLGRLECAHKWCFISNKQKGLIEVVSELAPHSEHSANKLDFEMWMQKIERADRKVDMNEKTASEWLREIPFQHWCRAYFQTTCKSDVLVNNLCESFNSYILSARGKPIISMFEKIRTKFMRRIQEKREGMERYAGDICPNILKKINKKTELTRNCWARWCGGLEFEVNHLLDKYVVDLALMTCTCGMFQLSGYPCCRAIAAIAERRTKTEDYEEDCYSKHAYLKVYENMIHVVSRQRDYIKTTFQVLRAPPLKRKRGRPRKNQIRGPGENLNSTRAGLTHTCQNCLQLGQNKASCTNPTHPASKWYKGPVVAEAQPSDAPQHVSQPVGTDAPQPT